MAIEKNNMISIIIPTRNEEKIIDWTLSNLKRGIRSTPYELIVSDGRSSDRTIQIAKRYAKVVLPKVGEKDNISKGRNRGARAARGAYFFFLDADATIPNPDIFFKKALSCFEKDPHLVAITGPIRVLDEYATLSDKLVFGLLNTFHYVMNNIFGAGRAAGEFQMVRADIFKKLGGYREDIVASEDYEFFTRLAMAGKTRYVPELGIYHTGRRAHAVGWPKLLTIWISNALSVMFRKKSVSKEWEEVR